MAGAVNQGPERTAAQDVGYGLRQVTDIVNKALSPGVNDPTTAVHGLGQMSALLVELTTYRLDPLVLTDDDDQARVVLHRPAFAELLEVCVAQPRSYGKADVQVLSRLYTLLEDLAWHASTEQRPAVLDQLRRLDATVADQDLDDVQTARLDELGQSVRRIARRTAGDSPAS